MGTRADPGAGPDDTPVSRAAATALIVAALGDARRQADWMRLHGTPTFSAHAACERGLAAGQIAIARYHLSADPDVATGAENEIRFLLGDYLPLI